MRVKGKTKSQKINAEQLKKFVPLSDKALQNMVNGGEALSPQQQYAMAQNVGKTAQESGGNYSTSFGAGGQNVTVTNKNTGTTTTTDTGNNSNFNFTGVGNGSFRPTANNPSGKPALSGAEQQAFANQQNPNIPSNYNIPGTGNANSDVSKYDTHVEDRSDVLSNKIEIPETFKNKLRNQLIELLEKGDIQAATELMLTQLNSFEKDKDVIERIEKAIKKIGRVHYDRKTGFQCDNYVQAVLTEAGFDYNDYFAGSAYEYTCDEHITHGKEKKTYSSEIPTANGVYVVLMGSGKEYTRADGSTGTYNSHAALLVIQDGYKPYIIDNSGGNILLGYDTGCNDLCVRSSSESAVKAFSLYNDYYFQKVG